MSSVVLSKFNSETLPVSRFIDLCDDRPRYPSLSPGNEILLRWLVAREYMNFYVEWIYNREIGNTSFRYSYGKLSFNTVELYDKYDGTPVKPMCYEEFYALLQIAYTYY